MLSPSEIAEIRKRVEAATVEPWIAVPEGRGDDADYYLTASDEAEIGGGAFIRDDAVFIAHARSDIPALLSDRDELVRRLVKVREMAIKSAGPQRWCCLCQGGAPGGAMAIWYPGTAERHAPDCPVAPMEDA